MFWLVGRRARRRMMGYWRMDLGVFRVGMLLVGLHCSFSLAFCVSLDEEECADIWICAVSGAGMLYLSLWLAAKFRVSFPHLSLPSSISSTGYTSSIRSQSAAPPAYLTALLLIPIAIGVYICGTVYSDFRHHGFDILFGGAMGSLFAYLSFRMYHAPITVGAGWAWGPRGNERPLWQGVGGSDWSGKERFEGEEEARCGDVEEGRSTTGSCLNGGNDVTRSR